MRPTTPAELAAEARRAALPDARSIALAEALSSAIADASICACAVVGETLAFNADCPIKLHRMGAVGALKAALGIKP